MLPSVSTKEEEGTQNMMKLSTYFKAGPIDLDANISINVLAGQPWILPADERPSMAQ